MKALRLVATCAVALSVGQAWAQESAGPPATPPVAQDVGGTTGSSLSDAGTSMKVSRQQVYQDLIRSQQSGEQSRLWSDTYRGGQ
jgi:hypothetical protein